MNGERGQQGYSLVELIITIGILAILMAIAIPNFSSMSKRWEYRSDIRLIYSELQKAKMEAVKTNSDQSYTVGNTDSGYNPDRAVDVTFNSRAILESATYVDDGSDAISGGNATITYPNPHPEGKTLSISVNTAGNISIN